MSYEVTLKELSDGSMTFNEITTLPTKDHGLN